MCWKMKINSPSIVVSMNEILKFSLSRSFDHVSDEGLSPGPNKVLTHPVQWLHVLLSQELKTLNMSLVIITIIIIFSVWNNDVNESNSSRFFKMLWRQVPFEWAPWFDKFYPGTGRQEFNCPVKTNCFYKYWSFFQQLIIYSRGWWDQAEWRC